MILFCDHGKINCTILSHLGSDINRVLKFPLIPVLIVSSSLAVAAFIYIALVVWGRFQRKRNDNADSSSSVIFNIFYQILSYYKFTSCTENTIMLHVFVSYLPYQSITCTNIEYF